MNAPLSQSVRVAAELRAKLSALYGLDEDDDAINGTIEGETDLPEALALLARLVIEQEGFAKAIEDIIRQQTSRKMRLQHRAERGRELIAWALQESGLKNLTLPDMSLGLSAPRKPVLVTGEVPKEFCRVEYKPNKTAIREALEAGETLIFASLGNPEPTLNIRRG